MLANRIQASGSSISVHKHEMQFNWEEIKKIPGSILRIGPKPSATLREDTPLIKK